MNITSAQYQQNLDGEDVAIWIVVDGEKWNVPNDAPSNRFYDEIMRQVEAGTLTIQDAD